MSQIKKRLNAFKYAFSGLFQALKKETHFRLQTIIGVAVIKFGFFYSISKTEWLVCLLLIGLVTSLELINSAIEKLCDLYSIEQNIKIKYIKDISAAAVLIVSILAAICGIIIFAPYLLNNN